MPNTVLNILSRKKAQVFCEQLCDLFLLRKELFRKLWFRNRQLLQHKEAAAGNGFINNMNSGRDFPAVQTA